MDNYSSSLGTRQFARGVRSLTYAEIPAKKRKYVDPLFAREQVHCTISPRSVKTVATCLIIHPSVADLLFVLSIRKKTVSVQNRQRVPQQ